MSVEIKPLAALYPPPPHKKCTSLTISALSGRRGRYAHAYEFVPLLLYHYKKSVVGGWGGGITLLGV